MGLPTLLVVYDEGSFPPRSMYAAARKLGVELVFIADEVGQPADVISVLRLFGRVVNTKNAPSTRWIDALARLRPAGIVTFAESQLPLTALLADELGLQYQPLSAMAAITEKSAQREAFRTAGLEIPRFRTVRTPEELRSALLCAGTPVLVKPTRGAGSRNTFPLLGPAEVSSAADILSTGGEEALIVEELLEGRQTPDPWGDYIAMDFLVQSGHPTLLVTSDKFALASPFRERGAFTPSRLPETELQEIEALCHRAIEAVGFVHGIADLEVKLTPKGPVVIELNGRMGAWVDEIGRGALGFSAGELAIEYAVGLSFRGHVNRRQSDGVAFQYLAVPPFEATRIEGVIDPTLLRRLPGVRLVSLTPSRGGEIDWMVGTASSVATIGGIASNHEELARTVRAADAILQTHFRSAQ